MLRKLLIIFIALETIGFFFASLLHFDITFYGYSEIHNPPEAVIQGIITILFAFCLEGFVQKKRWSFRVAILSHGVALLGAIFGIVATLKNGLALNYNLFNGLRLSLLFITFITLLSTRVKKRFI